MFDELLRKELLLRDEVSSMRRPRILVAETRSAKRTYLQSQLSSILEYDLTVTHNGWGALELALVAWQSGKPFDLILIDEDLPNLSGLEIVNYLRSKQYEGLVIGLSQNSNDRDSENRTAAGYDALICKDNTNEEIEKVISHFLERATVAIKQLSDSTFQPHQLPKSSGDRQNTRSAAASTAKNS